ncbi:XRE family transcriptional regulator [Streptomyces diacarni]|uniref:XRE family transcriptional regulator n=1 Tax=Streptomyces diacarni TaxID=2800381 RepID=UPI0033CEF7A8
MRDHDSQPAGPDHPGEDTDLAQLIQWVTDTTGDNQSKIARRIGVAPATVNAWVHRTRGGTRGPNKAALQRLAAEYRIPETTVFAAAGRKAPGPLSGDARDRLLALFEELTEEQQRSQEVQLRALVEYNRQGGSGV